MRYSFTILDVFTSSPFGGTQLAVLPVATGISVEGMQTIAREFNFAETTFVTPPADAANSCRVRIFTPKPNFPSPVVLRSGPPVPWCSAATLQVPNHLRCGSKKASVSSRLR